jgi:N-hydroxyarylamine O-acetyltransferase
MNLAAYFERVGFRGNARPDLPTLEALHRAHLHAAPFENLDVQLQRSLGLDVAASYEKIVLRRRGGWCYEMNGLMGWVLEQIGFEVVRVSAGVMRERVGDAQLGNHLCLLVQLEQPYLVDVGFGGSLAAPIPLRGLERVDAPYRISLGEADAGYWRFTERAQGAPFSFDFRPAPADEVLLAARCSVLQTAPGSSFVQNLVVQKRVGETHVSLRGRVVTTMSALGVHKVTIDSADELVAVLRNTFALDVPEAATLWPAICARHNELFGR